MSRDRAGTPEHDHFPTDGFESVAGPRTPSSGGERVAIGLAGLALFGGFLIAIANLIPDAPGVSSATPGPTAAVTPPPSRTPLPTRSPAPLREVTVQPRTPPSPSPRPTFYGGWMRAATDLVIRATPASDGREVGVLQAGQVAVIESAGEDPALAPGWFRLVEPAPIGWVRLGKDEEAQIAQFMDANLSSGEILEVQADADGFLASGWMRPEDGRDYVPFMARSADGASWQMAGAFPNAEYGFDNVAWGPAGWLAVVADFNGAPWIWRSDDGLQWDSLGVVSDLGTFGWPSRLVGSELGYLLETQGGRFASSGTFWFSTDGRTWLETADRRLSDEAWVGVTATRLGFYAWDAREQPGRGTAAGVFMADGRNWLAVDDGPAGPSAQVAVVGDRLLGLDVDPRSRAIRVWRGTVERAVLRWERDEMSERPFAGAGLATLVSDGQRAMALGWERATDRTLAWTSDGGVWTSIRIPDDGFGVIPRQAALLPGVAVVVGARHTPGSVSPVIWRQTEVGSWISERVPLIPPPADLSPDDCGPTPDDAFEFVVLGPVRGLLCLGALPISFRAWSVECEGCYGIGGRREPAWLLEPGRNVLYLSPLDTSSGYWSTAVVHPDLEVDPAWVNGWLEVTGHYDDPAAQDCRWTPSLEEEQYYTGRQATIDGCRQQFVVTEVTVVDGP